MGEFKLAFVTFRRVFKLLIVSFIVIFVLFDILGDFNEDNDETIGGTPSDDTGNNTSVSNNSRVDVELEIIGSDHSQGSIPIPIETDS